MLTLSFIFILAIPLNPLTNVLMGQPTLTYPEQMTNSINWAFIISLIPPFLCIIIKSQSSLLITD